jgi:hypothetical protein
MSVLVFYRENSEHARSVTEFLRDFKHRTAKSLEELSPDSKRGAELAALYDIVEYPSIVATTDDGELRFLWRGLPLPTIDEVSYYA